MSKCIEWQGARFKQGYGRVWLNGKHHMVHRLVFDLYNGYLPEVVQHKCDNPSCYNVEHLEAGTHKTNMADMVAKGRQSKGASHHLSKLSDDAVAEIRSSSETQTSLAKKFGVTQSAISQIKNGLTRCN